MEILTKRNDGRWVKLCPECKIPQDYLRKNYALESLKLNKLCKKCSNQKTDNCHRGMYERIRISWYEKNKKGAELRGLYFDITLQDIWDMYQKQDGKCALSGLDIDWASVGSIHTASIDRIDSSKGYILNNVQLVHKDINFMKQQFSQDYFIEMCQLVADKVKW